MSVRLYSLFEIDTNENGRKKYTRISETAYPKQTAIKVYQSALLAPYMGVDKEGNRLKARELRVVVE